LLLATALVSRERAGLRPRDRLLCLGGSVQDQTNSESIARDETFDEFLAKEGMLAETEELALKEIIANEIGEAMKERDITKTEMAARMKADRRQLERLLDLG